MKLLILNGPNLNLLGKREPELYGTVSFNEIFVVLKKLFPDIDLEYYQTNHEGAIIDKLHEVGFSYDGVILNAGAYSHTSLAIADAIAAIRTPVVEVHITNVFAREEYRRNSFISEKCYGVITGFGVSGYELAIRFFINGNSK